MENNQFDPIAGQPEEALPVIEDLTFVPEPEAPAPEPIAEDPAPEAVPEPEPLPEAPLPIADILPEADLEEELPTVMAPLTEPAPAPEAVPEVIPEPPAEPTPEELAEREYQLTEDFDTLFRTEEKAKAQEPAPAPLPRQTHKGRPRRKKGEGLLGIPNILATVVWLVLIVSIGVTAGRMLWICAADVLAFGREDKPVTITIYEADTMDDIIDKLYDNGLIRYKSLFSLYAGISDAEEDIQPGIYDLNTRYDYHALVNFMSPRSSREVIELTIPEGYTCRQIFSLLEEKRICTAVDLAAYAQSGDLSSYWFLSDISREGENCLEGYLFPDTYEFYKNSTPKEAIERMLDNFDNRFSEDMFLQLENLNATLTGDYTVREIVIVASLIEKESAAPAESSKIAGVIYNRLFKWEYPSLLNIDAAIVYAQGGNSESIDTKLDSPYNTYLYEGLTPGPISNPGLASIQAALNPESHNYYFYVLNPETGMHQFSTTQAEHEGWISTFYHN